MENHNQIIDEIIFELIEKEEIDNKKDFHSFCNNFYAKYKLNKPIPNLLFIERYNKLIDDNQIIENNRLSKLFRKRATRNLSGIAVISLLTKFFGCPGKCVFCPTFENLPKSYVPNEPAVMRAELNKFDPLMQVYNRLRSLQITGHVIDKCDIRIIGGTWTVYPKEYKEDFIKKIYDAHNTYDEVRKNIKDSSETIKDTFAQFELRDDLDIKLSTDLEEAKKINETAKNRVIGIAIETRPDWIAIKELEDLRKYGITRVEIGYQTTFDNINERNKRGHGNKESKNATKLLKDAGFKVVAHMMPNLLGSNIEMDKQSLKNVFDDDGFRPDELKIYPMVVVPKSELVEHWKNGEFKPYSDEELIDLMADMQGILPRYVRLNRMYRDIPSEMILAGSKLANLRQIVDMRMKMKGKKCVDISAREIRNKDNSYKNAVLKNMKYNASDGVEYFLTFEDKDDGTLFSLLRFRVPSQILSGEKHFFSELQDCGLIREVHTFGESLPIGSKGDGSGQHLGFGKMLLQEAERIAREDYNIKKMAIIAGVGVRKYFEKQGYKLDIEYMKKDLH